MSSFGLPHIYTVALGLGRSVNFLDRYVPSRRLHKIRLGQN